MEVSEHQLAAAVAQYEKHREAMRKYYLKNKEKILERNRQWYWNNLEKAREKGVQKYRASKEKKEAEPEVKVTVRKNRRKSMTPEEFSMLGENELKHSSLL